MSISNNINTNIDDYTTDELFQILNLDEDTNTYMVNKTVNDTIEQFKDRGDNSIIGFLKKARDRIIKELESDYIEENEVVEYQTKRLITQQELENETEGQWVRIRRKRTRYLTETDWTQLPDSPLTNQKQTEWQIYRQALRDITSQLSPFSISWPTPPEN